MISEYIKAAMRQAHYEKLADEDSFYGRIEGFEGVWANAPKLESCRDQLGEVLEEWILFRVSRNLPLPEVSGITLRIEKVA